MNKIKRMLIVVLRLLALGATASALIVMVTSHETAQVFNLKFEAKFSNSPTFKYFVVVEAIAAAYTLVALSLSLKSMFWRLVVVFDIVTTVLLTSGISAALGIAQVGKNGNTHAGWLPICDRVPKFCDHVTGSLVAGLAAAIIYFVISLYSLHAVLSPLFAMMKP